MKTYNVKRYILLTDADEMITSTQHPTTKNIKNKHSTQRRRRSNEFEMLEEHLEIYLIFLSTAKIMILKNIAVARICLKTQK